MLPLDDAFTTAPEQLHAWSATVRALGTDDWARPVPSLPGWDVEHLVRHLTEVTWAQAEAFHRSRLGILDQPLVPSIAAPASELADLIDLARGHLEAAIAAYTGDDWTNVPLPFAVIPAIFAASGIVLEYGIHRWDLDRSLGRDASLTESTQQAVLGIAGGLMPAVGLPAGDEPVAYRLEAPTTAVDLVWDGKGWGAGDADAVCIIGGDDETIALLVMGRVSVDHETLRVEDPDGTAAQFTDYFAGI